MIAGQLYFTYGPRVLDEVSACADIMVRELTLRADDMHGTGFRKTFI